MRCNTFLINLLMANSVYCKGKSAHSCRREFLVLDQITNFPKGQLSGCSSELKVFSVLLNRQLLSSPASRTDELVSFKGQFRYSRDSVRCGY